jgi:microcystin-dependent protein
MFAGSSAPTGYLLCDGSAVSRTTYSALFAVTSTTYGVGDNSTTFNLPDLRTRVPVGKNATGTFATLGATGGAETHTLTEAQLPGHTHTTNIAHGHSDTLAAPAHTHSIPNRPTVPGGTTANTLESWTTGTGTARTLDTGGASATALTGSVTALGTTNVTSTSTGSGSAHNILQPYIVLNYIIKV